jgi:hypothetical protein
MAVLRAIVLVATLLLVVTWAPAAEWKPAQGPLATRWAKDVTAEKALPEYPRPQMVRKDWQNLNGLWQWAEAGEGDAVPSGKDLNGTILVPYPIESALSGVMKHTDRLWYRRMFTVPKDWAGKRLLLHFGAVDWEAAVYVNGKKVGQHRGGYDPFTFDITEMVKADGPQELIVGVFDPTDKGGQPRGKQVLSPGGIMYTPTTGIWQTVWIEPVAKTCVGDIMLTPDVDGKCLRLTVNAAGDATGATVEAIALSGTKDVGKVSGKVGEELRISLADVHLWSPDDPFLYGLKVELKVGGNTVDAIESYFGMRKIGLAKDEKGILRPMLNGKFVFQVGPLDQGFWPDGLYTAPTDEALRFDIEITRKLGFNMTRKHVKVEPERWYYWCDKMGLMVWQDMPSGNNNSPEARKQFEQELKALVETHRNHPSIILWVVFNEGWGQYDTPRLTARVKEMDPSRLVSNASGWTDNKTGDVMDIHVYPGPGSPKPEEKRAAVLGEFGGLGLGVEGHTWKKEHWGYKGMAGRDDLTRQYELLFQKVYQFRDDPGLCAAVYTQITDVEVECNGLLTYDRAVVKPDMARVAAVNQGDFSQVPPPPIIKPVVPTSEKEAAVWRYTTDKPADVWLKSDFDDAAWKKGPGGFGTRGTPGAVVGTEWKTGDIWLRREMAVPEGKFTDLRFRVHHDEDVDIYINGVLAGKAGGFATEYQDLPMTPEGQAALKAGKNVMAVHCHQTTGGQFIDVGIVDVVPGVKAQLR